MMRPPVKPTRTLAVTAALLLAALSIAQLRADVDDLSALVPADCPIVAELHGLGVTWSAIESGPFLTRFRKQRLWAQMHNWSLVEQVTWWARGFSDQSGLPLRKTFDALAGRQAMMLAWPDGDRIAAVFLLRAPSSQALAELMPVFDRISRQNGTLEQQVYRGVTIRHRVIPPGQGKLRADYYAAVDNVLIMSLHPDRLKAFLDAAVDQRGRPTPPGKHPFVALRQSTFKRPAAVGLAYVNGRLLIKQKRLPFVSLLAESDVPMLASTGRELTGLFSAMDHAVLTLEADGGLGLDLAVKLHDKLPEGALKYVIGEPNAASTLLGYLPEAPGAASRWKIDLVKLNRAVEAFFGEPYLARIELVRGLLAAAFGGRNLQKDILPKLGPELMMVLSEKGRPVENGRLKDLVIPSVDLLVENRGPAEFTTRADQLLRRYVSLLALMTTFKKGDDATRASFYLDLHRDVPVGYLTLTGHGNPLGGLLEPSWCFVDKAMVISTDKNRLARTIDRRKTGKPEAKLPEILKALDPNVGFVYLDGSAAARMLRRNIPLMARKDVDDNVPERAARLAEAERKYAERIDSAQLLDYVIFTGTRMDEGFRWSLRARSTVNLRRPQ